MPSILAVLGLAGCGIGPLVCRHQAVELFSAQFTCPGERLTTRSVRISPKELFERPSPPPDVAADSGRLRYWEKKTDEGLANFHDLTLVDVDGCDARLTYLCWLEHPPDTDAADAICPVVGLDAPPAHGFGGFAIKPAMWRTLKQRLALGY